MSFLDSLLLERFSLSKQLSQELPLYVATITLVVAVTFCYPSGFTLLYQILDFFNVLPATVGCSKIGIPAAESKLLRDEYDQKYASGDAAGSGKSWKVKSLWIYPVKSCAGVELSAASVVKTGLQFDRSFTFAVYKPAPAQESSADVLSEKAAGGWSFATMREFPSFANIKTELWLPDPKTPGFSPSLLAVESLAVVRVVFPYKRSGWARIKDICAAWYYGDDLGSTSFTVPYQPTEASLRDPKNRYQLEPVKIWKDCPSALNMGVHVPLEALQAYVGSRYPMSLFRTTEMRPVYRDAPRADALGWQPIAAFNDAYPINLLALSSVRDLDNMQDRNVVGSGAVTPPELSARRFRANIIVEGVPPYGEERWKYVRIGSSDEYHVVARCVRCKMPNVDPDSGARHAAEPDRTIRKYRNVDQGAPNGTGCLAVQLVPHKTSGSVRVGDVIHVMDEGEHVYTPM